MSALGQLPPGAVFAADFRVVRRLGEGGMGALYVAEQLSTGRERALKLMHPTLVGSPALRDKFTLEARVGGRIESEHVVEVVAAGVDAESGVPWLAMELLVGEDLAQAVQRRGSLPPAEVALILGEVAHALGAAHRAGIVHRDLKPENVFLARSRRAAESFTVKVLDFGIAKVVEEARGANTGALGSPLWMAPEQTERDADITPGTDVWAMGLLAYAMLTGRPFWLAASPETGSLAAFMRELVIEPIPSASARALEQGVGGAIPPWFDGWFAGCLARDRAARFSDATAAFDALVAVLPWALPGRTSGASLPGSGPRASSPSAPGSDPSRGLGLGGTTPMSPGPATPAVAASATPPGLGTARTVHAAAAAEEHAPLPVEGGATRLGALVAVVALVGLGIGGAALLRGRGRARADVDAGIATALPPCPRGMVRIPGAEVTIGRDDGRAEEAPAHRVIVPPFCVDDGEVTASAFQQCVDGKACPAPPARAEWPGIGKEEQKTWTALCNFGKRDRSTHPMNCVTYDEAQTYCASQGRRLPSEAEWELAARGAEGRAYPWGNDPPGPRRVNACDKGCTRLGRAPDAPAPLLTEDDGWEATSPSGQLTEGASALGVFDLAGNVAEWTEGSFCPYGQPACGNVARTIRGGSFLSDDPAMLRGTARTKASPQTRAPHIGFRCAK